MSRYNATLLFLSQLTKPYAADSTPGHDDCADEKPSVKLPEIAGKVQSGIRSPGLRCMSPDYDTKEIKNIYVDCKLSSFPVLLSFYLSLGFSFHPYF